jgi:hypothetical protein
MKKTLKIWNGRSHGNNHKNCHYFVTAYSQKQAAELVAKGSGCSVGISEIRAYYASCWGTRMEALKIVPTVPCLYVMDNRTGAIVEMVM